MITQENLMKNSADWDWVDRYSQSMGDKALVDYSRKLCAYLLALPDDSEIEIARIVTRRNEDLFAKLVCRYKYEGILNLQFSADFRRLRKYEQKK
jgi:hypothetical protein